MNETQGLCLVISDYPIKALAYQKLLKQMNQDEIEWIDWIPTKSDTTFTESKLLIVDMNIPADEEFFTVNKLIKVFPKSRILFMEEDHNNLWVEFQGNKEICLLGKLADLNVTYAVIKEMLEQSNAPEKKPGKKNSKSMKSTVTTTE